MSKEKAPPKLTPGQEERIAGLFKMLGEPMRLRILQAVCHAPRTVGEIVDVAGSTQPNVSKHLALLAAAGILRRERNGQSVRYGVKNELALELCHLVRAHLGP
jgi:DNA-binding transcriptional ArsR family regulator